MCKKKDNNKPKENRRCKCLCICIMTFLILSIVAIVSVVIVRCALTLVFDNIIFDDLYFFLLGIALIALFAVITICATHLISKLIKECYNSKEESLSALNEAYDKIFGQDYSCEYKCWEKYNENPNYHYKLEKQTYKSRKPNDTPNTPTGDSQQQDGTK